MKIRTIVSQRALYRAKRGKYSSLGATMSWRPGKALGWTHCSLSLSSDYRTTGFPDAQSSDLPT